MRVLLLAILLLLSDYGFSESSELLPFRTDYCTNYPEGTKENPELWKHCCLIHDMYFWAGGSRSDRDKADFELKSCIEDAGAYRQARLMYLAVRAGSYSPYKYPGRKWNNGWRDRSSSSLSQEDIDKIENELIHGYDFITFDLKRNFINSLRSRLD